jgi:hypothetical protein
LLTQYLNFQKNIEKKLVEGPDGDAIRDVMFWVSGSDEFHEGIFNWCGTPKAVNVSMDFKFGAGEPNNFGGNENCIQSAVRGDAPPATFVYNDNVCSTPFRYVCEVRYKYFQIFTCKCLSI